jgi:AraC family transcriptional regulator of adaptative response / DNA-3-methyladenine glycosylase II
MALSRAQMIDRSQASDPAYDGRFVTGVLTTGIYCLPSCRARKPSPGNVRFFPDPQAARAAGLRPCKRCRPDDFYGRYDPDLELAEALVERVRRAPGEVPSVAALARVAGVGASKLHALARLHFHASPARLLTGARIDLARRLLVETSTSATEIAYEVGYESPSSFHDNFARRTGMSPRQVRRLPGARRFELRLPASYPLPAILAHLGRDPESLTERVAGTTYEAGAWLAGRPARIVAELAAGRARCRIEAAGPLPAEAAVLAHEHLLRRLGLGADPSPFEALVAGEPDLAPLVDGRRGLRVPRVADPFECLLWAILGQQVNLAFACRLVRRLVERAGAPAGAGLYAPPRPEAVAALSPQDLVALQVSRPKVGYLLALAARVAAGDLPLARLAAGSATRARETLLAERGLGPWSVAYVMMRGLGFADCVPVGDSGLTRALATFFRLPERPGPRETEALMERFVPHRSLATFHLWLSLDAPP